MSENNTQQKEDSGSCGPGCNCGTSGSGGRVRWIVGIVILLIAGVLVARAVIKEKGMPVAPASTGFAALDAPEQPPEPAAAVKPPVTDALKEVAAFSELNSIAMGSAGVFIYVPAKDGASKSPITLMQGAARTIEPQLKGKIGLFALKAGSPDYDQIASQMAVPGVIALVPGGRMVPVTGDITETKLVQALVGSVQSCGAGGCGPSGCN